MKKSTSRMLAKRKILGSAVDKRDLFDSSSRVSPEVFEQPSTDDQQVLEKSDPQPSSKQKRDKRFVGMQALCILLCFMIAGLIVLIWYLFDSHEKLIAQLDNQLKEIEDIKQCSALFVGFTVTFGGKDYESGCPRINLISGQPAKFEEVMENAGEGYDRETGYFTAPIPGLYSFQINIVAYDYATACLELKKKNEQPIAGAFAEDSWESGSTSAVLELAAGESVAAVACEDSRFSKPSYKPDLSRTTVFSGYLIEAANCKNDKGISGEKVDTEPTGPSENANDEKPLTYQHKMCLGDVCYYLVNNTLSWKEASAECKKHGKVLAEARTEAQADIIEELWKKMRKSNTDQIWIGGNNLDTGEWIWQGSKECIPMHWEEGVQRWTSGPWQPTPHEHCLTQWGLTGLPEGKESGWNNVQCKNKYQYVCQGSKDDEN